MALALLETRTIADVGAMKQMTKVEQHLQINSGGKRAIRERLVQLLDRESVVPSFSEAAIKLCTLTQDETASIEDFADVISMDPGLATRCIQIAGSVTFAARPIDSIHQALSLIGLRETQRIAFSVATIDTFAHFRLNIDWRRFWLHNILVARLCERVTAGFRETSGMEYLAGLLHDIGKLVLEHYFPKEFERIFERAVQSQCRFIDAERELLGLDHAQIGAAVCECLQVHPHVLQAVRFHHDALNPTHTSDPVGDGGFLAAAVSVADTLANHASKYIARSPEAPAVQESPEWFFLKQLGGPGLSEIDVEAEVHQAEEDINVFL